MKRLAVIWTLVLSALTVTPSAASDPLAPLRFLVGNWGCTYRAGAAHITYNASFGYAMGDSWIRERDSWAGGGSDEGFITYDSTRRSWIATVLENSRTVTLFKASGKSATHIVYRSVYPDASMTDVFDRVSATRYTLHFSRTVNGKVSTSVDTCVKR